MTFDTGAQTWLLCNDPCADIRLGSVVRLLPGEKIIAHKYPSQLVISIATERGITRWAQKFVNERLYNLDDEPHGLAALNDAPTNNPGTI